MFAVPTFMACTAAEAEERIPAYLPGIVVEGSGEPAEEPAGEQTETAPVRTTVYGYSVEGRDLQVKFFGDRPVTIVLIGGLHTGAEAETVDAANGLSNYLAEYPELVPAGIRLAIIENANPDGYAAGTRTNSNAVDLNRNWPTSDWTTSATHGAEDVSGGEFPLSEPETAALYDLLLGLAPDFVLTLHGYAGLVQHNGAAGADYLTSLFADAAGYVATDVWEYYDITGELIDAMADAGIAAADIELIQEDPDSFTRMLDGLAVLLAGAADASSA